MYLARYADYEERIAAALLSLARSVKAVVRPAAVCARIRELFHRSTEGDEPPVGLDGEIAEGADRQRLAAAVACHRRLTVVSGGPGTGKTTTVVGMLVLLIEQRLANDDVPRVMLLAPTGKAAQRLSESIRKGLDDSGELGEEVRAAIPDQAMTVHRALGFRPQSPSRFRHDSSDPLSADLVVVDEASMIDVAMFAKLLDALPRLRSWCCSAIGTSSPRWRPARSMAIFAVPVAVGSRSDSASILALFGVASRGSGCPGEGVLADCVVELVKRHRYTEDSGIAALAQAIQSGDPDQVIGVLQGGFADVEWAGRDVGPAAIERELVGRIVIGGRLGVHPSGEVSPKQRLAWLADFRVLAAHRRGRLGVEAIIDWSRRTAAEVPRWSMCRMPVDHSW